MAENTQNQRDRGLPRLHPEESAKARALFRAEPTAKCGAMRQLGEREAGAIFRKERLEAGDENAIFAETHAEAGRIARARSSRSPKAAGSEPIGYAEIDKFLPDHLIS